MRQLAGSGARDPRVREVAIRITQQLLDHDFMSEYAALFNWVRRNIRYIRDPIEIEQVQTPHATLQLRTGDCDDLAVLLAALTGAIGGRSRFVAGAFRHGPNGKPSLSHVWCEAHEPQTNTWVVLDPVPGRRVPQMLGALVHTLHSPAVE